MVQYNFSSYRGTAVIPRQGWFQCKTKITTEQRKCSKFRPTRQKIHPQNYIEKRWTLSKLVKIVLPSQSEYYFGEFRAIHSGIKRLRKTKTLHLWNVSRHKHWPDRGDSFSLRLTRDTHASAGRDLGHSGCQRLPRASALTFGPHLQTQRAEVKVRESKTRLGDLIRWPLTFCIILLGSTLIRQQMTLGVTRRCSTTDCVIINYRQLSSERGINSGQPQCHTRLARCLYTAVSARLCRRSFSISSVFFLFVFFFPHHFSSTFSNMKHTIIYQWCASKKSRFSRSLFLFYISEYKSIKRLVVFCPPKASAQKIPRSFLFIFYFFLAKTSSIILGFK